MSALEKKISELLNEEKWTRATLNNYSVNQFQELDELLKEIEDEQLEAEVIQLCSEHLEHSRNSIIALYLTGLLSMKRQQIDDSSIVNLINIFVDNHRWNVVEFLAKAILNYGENKFALKTLEDCYNNDNREELLVDIWERLIRIDYEEAAIVRKLAEYFEAQGNIDGAISYYKKSIQRFISKTQYASVRDIWQKLVEFIPEDYEFFFQVEYRASKIFNSEKSVQLLEDLYPPTQAREDWDVSIEILKRILNYDSKNNWARNEIVNCYSSKYAEHSHLEEYIRLSNLTQGWRNVLEAISDFEKHISFDKGNFVFHKSWGVGVITNIIDDNIEVDFVKKRGHSMSLKMAVNALQSLNKDHIWVLKSVFPKDQLKEKIKSDHVWALSTIIKSFDNSADLKKIKSELVPAILTAGEWTSWSTAAKEKLKKEPDFGNDPEKMDHYVVRDKPMSYEERTYNSFKTEKNFFNKIHYLEEFLSNEDPDSDYFAEMFQYFTGFLKSANINAQVVCSFLFVNRISRRFPFLAPNLDWGFTELFEDIEEFNSLFMEIVDVDLKNEFLTSVKENVENWPDIFLSIFPLYQSKYIIDELKLAGLKKRVAELFRTIVDRYRDYRDSFLWLAKNYSHESTWQEQFGITYEKVLINLIHLLDLTYRDILNKKDATQNRKINRGVEN
ncbi:MAG: transcription elongation factor GreA [Spirochaetaceae bacterium]|jgi:transcription elongation factor GreA-like protein|nr:transcription elongation factor GreA [Spirochaetaceae bacterium]